MNFITLSHVGLLTKLIKETSWYQNWKRLVLSKNNYKCSVCRSKGQLEAYQRDKSIYDLIANFQNNYGLQIRSLDDVICHLDKQWDFWSLDNSLALCPRCSMVEYLDILW